MCDSLAKLRTQRTLHKVHLAAVFAVSFIGSSVDLASSRKLPGLKVSVRQA